MQILIKSDAAGKPSQFLLIDREPKELTVVHVTGSVDLAQLRELVSSKIAFGGTIPEAPKQ